MGKTCFKLYLLILLFGLSIGTGKSHAYDLLSYEIPSYQQVKSSWSSSDIKFLASNGKTIQRIRRNFTYRSGDWLALEHISPLLIRAVIASEDKRFYKHSGVDWLASAHAAWSSLLGDSLRGASTITMQLAAMLDKNLRRSSGGRSIAKKIDQMQMAQIIELSWTKEQILEAYLNLANFKGELVGIDVLSRVLFQTDAASLNLRQAALSAVLLRGPNADQATISKRTCVLLKDSLGRNDLCKDLYFYVAKVLSHTQLDAFFPNQYANHFARLILKRSDAGNKNFIKTSISYSLQTKVNDLVHRHLVDLSNTGITDAAVVVLDNKTGAVLSYVGSSGVLSEADKVDHALAKRQAGSTLKPFLYALAFDQQRLTAASLLNDAPLDINAGSGLYVPDNYDHIFTGWVSVRTALASSLNIPAVRALTMTGIDSFARSLNDLGLGLKHQGEYYGFSLALGSADISLLDLTNAYRTLARLGHYQDIDLPTTTVDSVVDNDDQVFSAASSWIIGDILSDRQARARTFGLSSALATPYWTAVKTGTSRDMRDNWCIGWSDQYTVGVWVGNSAGLSMRNVSGVTGAGPIWRDVFGLLNINHKSVQPAMPKDVTRLAIKFENSFEPERKEYFIGDTGQAVFRASLGQDDSIKSIKPHIIEPVDGTVLALDPEIPMSKQKMLLLAVDVNSNPVSSASWYINGRLFASVGQTYWHPRPGKHTFELKDNFGKVIDKATVKVNAMRVEWEKN